MAEDSLPNLNNLIDGLRARLHEELELQLRGITESHARALEQARQAADAEAEERCTARLEVVRGEWNTRLEAAVASARAETERAGAAEAMRVRLESEQAVAAAAASVRGEFEQSSAAERQRIQLELEAERRRVAELEPLAQRAGEIEAELRRIASDREAHLQRVSQLEAEVQRQARDLEAERHRVAGLEAERQRLVDLDADRDRSVAEIERLRQRSVTELDALRQRVGELEASPSTAGDASAASSRERQHPEPATAVTANGRENRARLIEALRAVDEAGSVSDVLTAAVRGAEGQARRAALFVVEGTDLREWPIAGMPSVASGPLSVEGREAGVIAAAVKQQRPAATGGPDDLSAPDFAALPPGSAAVAVPLVLGGTAVAVLYADQPESAAGTSWQENVQILGRHAAACAASLTALRTAQAMRMFSGDAPDEGSGDAADQLQSARRYARLLVSEIKLYNEGAVRVGRERRDILVRLEAEIERARRLFDERVAASVEGRDALFQQELAQTLADGDPSLLGEPRHQPSSWT